MHNTKTGTRQNAGRGGSERWQFADLYLRISDHCRVRVTVRIRAWVRVRVRIGIWVRVRVKDRNRDRLGLGLRIVVYKLLEKVTKCGSITWLQPTIGVPPRRSAPLRILSCPTKTIYEITIVVVVATDRPIAWFCLHSCLLSCLTDDVTKLYRVY